MATRTTADRILEAAVALWHDGGFGAVTTRAVAARAGVNEVTLFRHFASKEGLLKAMVARAVSCFAPRGGDLASPSADLEQDLQRWAEAYLDRTLPVGDLILLGLVEARGRPDLAAACLEAPGLLQASLAEHLEAMCDAGRLERGPFADIAGAFYATLFAHVLTGHLRDADAGEVAARTARVFSRALQGRDRSLTASEPSERTAGGAPLAP